MSLYTPCRWNNHVSHSGLCFSSCMLCFTVFVIDYEMLFGHLLYQNYMFVIHLSLGFGFGKGSWGLSACKWMFFSLFHLKPCYLVSLCKINGLVLWLMENLNNYTFQKMKCSIKVFSVNMTKSTGFCEFCHTYWSNPSWKTSFFVQCYTIQ